MVTCSIFNDTYLLFTNKQRALIIRWSFCEDLRNLKWWSNCKKGSSSLLLMRNILIVVLSFNFTFWQRDYMKNTVVVFSSQDADFSLNYVSTFFNMVCFMQKLSISNKSNFEFVIIRNQLMYVLMIFLFYLPWLHIHLLSDKFMFTPLKKKRWRRYFS